MPDDPASSVQLSDVVDLWFAETMNSLPAIALTTWNFLVAAKDDLKRRLEKENA